MEHYSKLDFKTIKYNKQKERNQDKYICSVPFAFDIEVSTMYKIEGKWKAYDNRRPFVPDDYYKDCEKKSWCYIWQFGFMQKGKAKVYYGRTLEEFKIFITELQKTIDCTIKIYVHNLSYEFQFLRNIFDDMKVFARKQRKPMKFSIYDGKIEFCCSYILSNMSLDSIGKNLTKTKKLVGNLNYNNIYFPDSDLSDEILAYCENDIIVLLEYIEIELKSVRKVGNIPMTATGKVRKLLRKTFFNDKKYNSYCQRLVPSVNEFIALNNAYTGAYTHTNPLYTDIVCNNIQCEDIASSYILSLIAYEYPASRFYKSNAKKFEDIDSKYLWVAKVRFTHLESKLYMNFLSYSHCKNIYNAECDNGKIQSCDRCETWLTNVDYEIMQKVYDFDTPEILELWVASKSYLNDKLRNMILDLYANKTSYKNVEGKEELYRNSKSLLNSIYGMFVTNLVASEIVFTDKWEEPKELTNQIIAELLDKQRNSNKTLTAYSWGVFCTAYSRARLWNEALIPINQDVVYTDTDSCKHFVDYSEHFAKVNENIKNLLQNCKLPAWCEHKTHPKDPKGIERWLGVWESEGTCDIIAQGSKKYATSHDGEIEVTVAGLSKKLAITNPKLKTLYDFRVDLKFDIEQSGRLTAYYLDDMKPEIIEGHLIPYKYGIALQPTTYTLGHSVDYDNFLANQSLPYELEIVERWKNQR